MSIVEKLASSQNRRDEEPNIILAKQLAETKSAKDIEELIQLLGQKNKDLQNDSIKVLYEIGALNPDLIFSYHKVFLELLHHKNNRLQWGAMTALNAIALCNVATTVTWLPQLAAAAEKGSVITKDNFVMLLVKLYPLPELRSDVFYLFREQLLQAPTNQMPSYAEQLFTVIAAEHKGDFKGVLNQRIKEIEKESKRKRIEKIIKKL